MQQRLTNQEVWIATLLFVVMDILILSPLPFVLRKTSALDLLQPIGSASALFWGMLVILFLFCGWDMYYRFFYPTWIHWLAPLDIPLYGAIGLGLWWLASHLPGASIFWFVLFGGVEGIVEHILGIYGFRILDKVPWLKDVKALPALVFSFFEYGFYWTLVVWLAIGLRNL
ncbi:MAG: hypothetical protein A2Z14_03440 [Chloroflexi bacterium RBG_16_48_8]|nr:MAG: hypothetical protein A2Z14_03440 [Chloroflexi bacterium RBG_16_48_8]